MKKYFIILTADGEIFSEQEFATEQQAADWARAQETADWARAQETDERLFIEPIIEVV